MVRKSQAKRPARLFDWPPGATGRSYLEGKGMGEEEGKEEEGEEETQEKQEEG